MWLSGESLTTSCTLHTMRLVSVQPARIGRKEVMGDAAKSAAPTKHVAIVGAGFAGLNCAKRLASDPGLQITLIDKNKYQQFPPSISGTCQLEPPRSEIENRNAILRFQRPFGHRVQCSSSATVVPMNCFVWSKANKLRFRKSVQNWTFKAIHCGSGCVA